jgi:hypothetical protein
LQRFVRADFASVDQGYVANRFLRILHHSRQRKRFEREG